VTQASPAARVIREIEVHGGVKNWFIDVREPMRCKVEIGYLTSSGRFHGLARSNAVTTPPASQSDTLDVHWGEILGDCDRIYAMSGGFSPENNSTELQELFEERLRRPMGPPSAVRAEPAAYRDQLRAGEAIAKQLEELLRGAATPERSAAAATQLKALKANCTQCHRQYRDLPDRDRNRP
jgi:hypothetical protein